MLPGFHASVRDPFLEPDLPDFDPLTYLSDVREEIPQYEALQCATITATLDRKVHHVLELGAGTGETTLRLLGEHPGAELVGLDANADMLKVASTRCPAARFVPGRMQGPLPPGPFDLVVAALSVHHLHALEKASLFQRVHGVLEPCGRFVLADLVVPDDPADVVTEVDGQFDVPSRVDEQLAWLREAGFRARLHWCDRDLAVLVADRSG